MTRHKRNRDQKMSIAVITLEIVNKQKDKLVKKRTCGETDKTSTVLNNSSKRWENDATAFFRKKNLYENTLHSTLCTVGTSF